MGWYNYCLSLNVITVVVINHTCSFWPFKLEALLDPSENNFLIRKLSVDKREVENINLPLLARVSRFTGPFDSRSSSLPQAQSTVVLIKLYRAVLTFTPMVIVGAALVWGTAVNQHTGQSRPQLALAGLISPNLPPLSKHWAWGWLWNLSS